MGHNRLFIGDCTDSKDNWAVGLVTDLNINCSMQPTQTQITSLSANWRVKCFRVACEGSHVRSDSVAVAGSYPAGLLLSLAHA